ncbi:MAG: hypothetical protein IJU60_06295 [Acholeplasmatales bacterium]|nr:hypothetical protein [Acholeplasmatales bacterium]
MFKFLKGGSKLSPKANLIMSIISVILCSLLLVFAGYGWYVASSSVGATGLTASTAYDPATGHTISINPDMDTTLDGRSTNVIPGELTELQINVKLNTDTESYLRFTPSVEWKDVNKDANTGIFDQITTKIRTNLATTLTYTDLDKLALVDEYYTYTSNVVAGDTIYTLGNKAYLTDDEKREIFRSFYEDISYNILNKVYFTIVEGKDNKIAKTEFPDLIADYKGARSRTWYPLSQAQTLHLTEVNMETDLFLYLYFDERDDIIPYKGSNASLNGYCFKGENQYFYQQMIIDLYLYKD